MKKVVETDKTGYRDSVTRMQSNSQARTTLERAPSTPVVRQSFCGSRIQRASFGSGLGVQDQAQLTDRIACSTTSIGVTRKSVTRLPINDA
jgi:hypothetical protein